MAGVLFALPVVALGAYGWRGGRGLPGALCEDRREHTDYSVMNTAKQMVWLPTTREEKYKAKQAIDTFFVRIGDLLAAGGRVRRYLAPVELSGWRGSPRSNIAVVLIAMGVAVAPAARIPPADRRRRAGHGAGAGAEAGGGAAMSRTWLGGAVRGRSGWPAAAGRARGPMAATFRTSSRRSIGMRPPPKSSPRSAIRGSRRAR